MSNEYIRYAKVTVTGKFGVRIRSWNDSNGSKVVQTAGIVSNDPIAKSKLFPLEPDKFLPTDVIKQFIMDCDFDYILDISTSYHTYKLVEVNEIEINGREDEQRNRGRFVDDWSILEVE